MFPTTYGNRLQYTYFQEHVWTPTLGIRRHNEDLVGELRKRRNQFARFS
jgi:hypothetical protein